MKKEEIIEVIKELIVEEHDRVDIEDLNSDTCISDIGLSEYAISSLTCSLDEEFGLEQEVMFRVSDSKTIGEMAAIINGENIEKQVEDDGLHPDERAFSGAIKQCLLKWGKKHKNEIIKKMVLYNMDGSFNLFINPALKDEYDLQSGEEYVGIYHVDIDFENEDEPHHYLIGYRVASIVETSFPSKEKINLDKNLKVYTMSHDGEEIRDDLRKRANKLASESYEVFCRKF